MSDIDNKDSTSAVADTAATLDPVLLAWTSQPAKARPKVAIAVGVFIVALVYLSYVLTESPLFAVVAALILWGSLSQFYLRTTFEFTEQKVKVKYAVNKVEKDWSQYRSYYVDKNGVLLSPFVRPSRLENFRGIYIRFADNRDEVVAIVKSKIRIIEDDV